MQITYFLITILQNLTSIVLFTKFSTNDPKNHQIKQIKKYPENTAIIFNYTARTQKQIL